MTQTLARIFLVYLEVPGGIPFLEIPHHFILFFHFFPPGYRKHKEEIFLKIKARLHTQ
jgi:hypothetical protein